VIYRTLAIQVRSVVFWGMSTKTPSGLPMTMEKGSIEPALTIAPVRSLVRPEHITAVRFNALQRCSAQHWRLLIRERIAPRYRRYAPPDPKRTEADVRKSHLDKLLDLNAFDAISEIWLTSKFVSCEELECAGGKRKRPLSKQSLARRLQEIAQKEGDFSDPGTFEGRAHRLVEAMLSYGLLEEEIVRPNLKILHPTELLHALMVTFHTNMVLGWESSVGQNASNDTSDKGGA